MSQILLDFYRREPEPGAAPKPDARSGRFWRDLRNRVTGHPRRRGLPWPEGKKPSPPERQAYFW